MKKILLRSVMSLLAVGLLFTACKKQNEEPAEDFIAVEDNNTGQSESDDAVAVAETVMADNNSNMRTTGDMSVNAYCDAVITLDKASKKITIDFGDGKTCDGNKTRKGKIIITYTGKYRVEGATQTLTFKDYYVNNVKVEGTKVFTHVIAGSTIKTRIVVTSGKLTFGDDTKVEWNSDRYRIWDGKNTPALSDDEITVTGSFSGKSKKEKNFTATITKPILFKVSCLQTSGWAPVSGTLEVTPEDKPTRTLDYGDGGCDRTFTASVNGHTFTRSIP